MKMKLRKAVELYNDLTEKNSGKAEEKTLVNKILPSKFGYAISKNIVALGRESELFNKERERLCMQLCKKDDEGKPVMKMGGRVYDISDEDLKILNKELEDLLNTEIEIEVIKVKKDILNQTDASERYQGLSVEELMMLDFMIEE
jgi:hypothetical protein